MLRLIARQQLHGKAYGSVAVGEEFNAPDMEARILIAKGRAHRAKAPPAAPAAVTPRPPPVAGPKATSSASPAAPASPQTSAKKSGAGASKKRSKKADRNDE